ncbi:MAG: cell division protein SepF [Ruminococcaceae bacterium]|nr:cell division protein SepF [Oscillospiraceae bacterium]
MGFLDKFKNWIGDVEEADDDEMEDTVGKEDSMDFVTKTAAEAEEPVKRSNKVVNIHATAQLQVVLVKPERFDDASTVADHLNAKRTVVLNLENANKDVARRILDFLSGVAYANDGQIKKVANCTFIITPYNVGIMGDLLDELENNGLYF